MEKRKKAKEETRRHKKDKEKRTQKHNKKNPIRELHDSDQLGGVVDVGH